MGAIRHSAVMSWLLSLNPWLVLVVAGLFEVAGPSGQISIDFNVGYGFTAIIVACLGRLNPIGILLAGLLMALTYIGGELASFMLGLPSAAIQAFQGVRRAEAGEFTRRSFANGRMDLNEAEGLADLLSAETEWQRRAANLMFGGAFSAAIEQWRQEALRLSALTEAELDFSDEDDVDSQNNKIITSSCSSLETEIKQLLAAPAAEKLKDGLRVVLGGPPNCGKSTLLNVLVEREAAIVSDIAGTTRDMIEVPIGLDGIALVFTDTAGLRDHTDDVIERIGIDRSQAAMHGADILLWLADTPPPREDALWLHSRADVPGREGLPAGRQLAVRRDDGASIAALWHAVAERAAAAWNRASSRARAGPGRSLPARASQA